MVVLANTAKSDATKVWYPH